MSDENHNATQLQQAFGDKSLYEILELTPDSCDASSAGQTYASSYSNITDADIKKAYRRLALRYHPDKGGDAQKFQALSVAHSILSDADKRRMYDQSGSVEELEEMGNGDFNFWFDYFRNLFPKLTIKKIDEFSRSYKNSAEEKADILKIYVEQEGDVHRIMECVMLAESGEENRICAAIDAAIAAEEIPQLPKYKKTRAAVAAFGNSTGSSSKGRSIDLYSNSSRSSDVKGSKKTMKSRKQQQKQQQQQQSDDQLVAMLQQNSNKRAMRFADIASRYSSGQIGGAGGAEYEIPDDEFDALQAKICRNKKQKK